MDFRDELQDAVPLEPLDADRAERVRLAVALIEDGPTTEDRALGITRLGQLGERADLVEAAARSRSAIMRSAAANSLGSFPRRATGPDVLRGLASDQSPRVRRAAMSGIGRAGRIDLLDLLLDVVADVDESAPVRSNALIAAGRVAGNPADQQEVFDAALRADEVRLVDEDAVVTCLANLDLDEALADIERRLGEMLKKGDVPPRAARSTVRAFKGKELSPSALELIVQSLDALPGARGAAAGILRDHPTESARASLERLLVDPSPRLTGAVVRALASIGFGPSQEALKQVIARDDQLGERVVIALGSTAESVELLEHLARTGPFHRETAIRSLAEADPLTARSVAHDLMADSNPKVRLAAMEVAVLVSLSEDDLTAIKEKIADERVAWVRERAMAVVADSGRPVG